MRALTAAVVLLLIALAWGMPSAATAPDGIGVKYEWDGPVGHLSIAHAAGMPYVAWRSDGTVSASGVAEGAMFQVFATNSGYDAEGIILRVRVGAHFHASIPDEEWIWE